MGTTHVSIPRIPWMPTSRRMTLGVPEPSDCNGLTMFTDSLGNAVHQREEQLQLWTYKSTKPLYLFVTIYTQFSCFNHTISVYNQCNIMLEMMIDKSDAKLKI